MTKHALFIIIPDVYKQRSNQNTNQQIYLADNGLRATMRYIGVNVPV